MTTTIAPPAGPTNSSARPFASVTDIPLSGKKDEALGITDYAEAMVAFIHDCATPLTIGIQGEWGSGKTSLLHMIQEDMEAQNIATSWVNTWEYSMFRAPNETAPAVLRGMLEGLRDDFEGKWPDELNEAAEKVSRALKGLGKLAVNIAGAKATGQANVTQYFEGEQGPLVRAEIAELKRDLAGIIERVVEDDGNSYQKVVFFIDDLDRLEPPVAVNVLESIKNIFDLPHCVFILAIDYDVVVKGLKHKFGEKTAENEREFRSFFDKIIQVPFSMPTGAYDIEKMLRANLGTMGFTLDDAMGQAYRAVLTTTVGGNPRSLKRYVNTFSLLRRLRELQARADAAGDSADEPSDDVDSEHSPQDDFILFALIGIQIAYPRVYSLLVKDPDFVSWSIEETPTRLGLPLGDATEDQDTKARLEALDSHELTDEAWEKFVWLFCQRDPWLRARSAGVLTTLNQIRKVVGDDDITNALTASMQIANMTSVDDDPETQTKTHQRVRHENWDSYSEGQKARNIPTWVLEDQKKLHDWVLQTFGRENLIIAYTPTQISYKPLSHGKRGKVFIYSWCQKKGGVKLYLPLNKAKPFYTEMKDEASGHPNGELESVLRESYQALQR